MEFAHGAVVPGVVVPYVIAEGSGSGTVGIGLTPLVPVSVAPSGIALPITLEPEGEAKAGVLPLPDVVVQLELGAVIPPPSKVEEVDDVLLIPPEVPLALQVELGTVPRPPGSISVAPSGMPVLFVPFVPMVLRADVVPNADGVTVVCALLAAQPQNSVRAVINSRRRIEVS